MTLNLGTRLSEARWLLAFGAAATIVASDPFREAPVDIQHPLAGAVLPQNMPSPVVLWRTNLPGVSGWSARFAVGRKTWFFDGIQPMWRPPAGQWGQIRRAAGNARVELTVLGHEDGETNRARARGVVRFSVARESVAASLFFREVNLPFAEAVKDPSKIRWRFGSLDGTEPPPVVLEKLPVCGNCHSFSRNAELLAMDVDYSNNKGSYVITKTQPEMRLATSDIITWDDYHREDGRPTLGMLSQISPDGRYVASTVKDMSLFMAKPDLAFSQLFFPFKGIVGLYDREAKRFDSLPGADDPGYVQTNPSWSPDGHWIIFARAPALEGEPTADPGRILLTGEAGEAFMRQAQNYRYDLCRVAFAGGKGGRSEPLRGASNNGRSNFFPRYSPDGRWIVFCESSRYMLLQPDSELFIIPATGGEARRLGCNLGRMNSWHSWSPDGRWLVFSSKAHSDYTQLYLSRISAAGEASPPVWLAHMVAPGRAANIPEFTPLPAGGIDRIREQFLDDVSYVRAGDAFYRAGEMENAEEKYRLALSVNPDNARARHLLGILLFRANRREEAQDHLRAASRLDPENAVVWFDLGLALTAQGNRAAEAIGCLEEAVRLCAVHRDRRYGDPGVKPGFPETLQLNLGNVYEQAGNAVEAAAHFRKAVSLAPDFPQARFSLGRLLLKCGELVEAGDCFEVLTRLAPTSAEAHNSLGVVRQREGRGSDSVACFQRAVQCDPKSWRLHLNLGVACLALGDRDRGMAELEEVLRLEPACEPALQALARARAEPN